VAEETDARAPKVETAAAAARQSATRRCRSSPSSVPVIVLYGCRHALNAPAASGTQQASSGEPFAVSFPRSRGARRLEVEDHDRHPPLDDRKTCADVA